MTPAEIAVWRHRVGLSVNDAAGILGVNPRTIRSWESGRDAPSAAREARMVQLLEEHTALAAEMAATETPIAISRDRTAGPRPRGWYVAAAARAMEVQPALEVEWRYDVIRST